MTVKQRSRSDKIMNLSKFPHDVVGTVVDIIADVELQGRLMGMGLFTGTRFRLLRSCTPGSNIPLVLAIGETRIALDKNIAEMILVEL